MSEKNLINYSLFYSRNNFDPVKFIKNNSIENYEQFLELLRKKSVASPGEEYYKRVVDFIESEKSNDKNIVNEKQSVEIESLEDDSKESVEEKVELIKVLNKSSKKRKRKNTL